MKIQFWGAAQEVTGSMHLLTLDSGYKLLIDCGLNYDEQRHGSVSDNPFPFNPEEINAVILTHAHIDHSGKLPVLVKHGFAGDIICTPPTAVLTQYLLQDSLNIMEAQFQKGNKNKKQKKSKIQKGPLPAFGHRDFKETISRFFTIHYGELFKINDSISIELFKAGHILGAAGVKITVEEKDTSKTFGFTGDLGNYNSKLMSDPTPMGKVDYLITESTYGGRLHKASRSGEEELLHYINKTCIDQPGRLVIPAFSVGRTQSIIFALNLLYVQGLLPDIKYFVDSPLAIRTTHLYAENLEYLNEEAQQFHHAHGDLFEFPGLIYLKDKEDSLALEDHFEPCVIISAAGMVEGGRIQEHVRKNIKNAYCTILIAGFCAEGTLGHRLLNGQGTVRIYDKEHPVFASVASTDAFSAHPDQVGLLRYLAAGENKDAKKIFLVHGEAQSMVLFKNALELDGFQNVVIPRKGEEFFL